MFDDRGEIEQHQIFTRRAALFFGAQLGVAGLLGARLYQLQLVENDAYATLAEENRINVEPLAAKRGVIRARDGALLASNRPNYRVNLVRERAADIEQTIGRLRQLITLSDREIERLMKGLRRTRGFVPVPVKENLTWEEFARLNANVPALPGLTAEVAWVRDYPEGEALAHVIGYVGAVTEAEIKADETQDPLLRLRGARIGKIGMEKAAEKRLRGGAGQRRYEVNAGGREIRELSRDPGRSGDDLDLTINLDLQRFAMERLRGESAAVVVMDVRNGDLLAIASAPAFDPNKFVFGIGVDDWNALRNDEYDPLRNKAVSGAYPPGSTFKMITALAALHHDVMSPEEVVVCRGKIRVGDRYFHCWKRDGHGPTRMLDALKNSCDVYFYECAKRVGIDRLSEMASLFGVGELPDIEMTNLKRGNNPTPDWLFGFRGERWTGGDTLNVGIGQGALLMTPLQLAVMTARLANGERKVRPRLLRPTGAAAQTTPDFEPLGLNQEHVDFIWRGMDAVSNERGGTAYRSRIPDPERAMAGKTGTAQVRRITTEERAAGVRKNEDLPWRLRDHALFVAFAPLIAPRYAISVVVEHGGGGSTAAAPVARDVLMRALWGGEPPLSAYPPEVRAEEKARREAANAPPAPPAPSPEDARLGPIWGVSDRGRPT